MTVDVRWASLTAAGADLLGLLSDAERRRVDSLSRPADQARSLLAAALLRVVVAEHLGRAPEAVVVDRTCAECGGPHGAPRIVSTGGRMPHVSVSHSGLLVVVAVIAQGPVGVDVQRVADLPDPADAGPWVRREARLKARSAADRGVTATGTQAGERGAGPREAGPWEAGEEATGVVAAGAPVAVRNIDAPLDGYAAALAGHPEQIAEPLVRQWSGPRGLPGTPSRPTG